ncbi:MAG TPA: glycolate oxidase subunit GlcE, partial [Steroidobacteraceae bacterium]|nr:glycolate oxidase subunit GlcE [Steroidobacteraceae bacterium]
MEAELQRIRDRVLAAQAQRTPLRLRGAGTKDFYGEHCEGELLDLSGWAGVLDYEPSELVITARCGTRLSLLEPLLAQHGQYFPFEPPVFGGDPTLGGMVAAGLSGPTRPRAGAVRDYVLGASLLGVDGELLRFGGQVMKNVAGFDVSRLLCGSLGILGPILEVSLKVLPLPRAQQSLRFELTLEQALERFSQWRSQPLPIHAGAWTDGAAWIRLCGADAAVNAACGRLGGERIEHAEARSWWMSVRDQTHPFFREASTLWRLSVPPTAPPAALPGVSPAEPFIEWSGALRWYAQPLEAQRVRAAAQAAGGTALHWRGAAPGQRFHPLSAEVQRVHERLKAQFDAHGIFNR